MAWTSREGKPTGVFLARFWKIYREKEVLNAKTPRPRAGAIFLTFWNQLGSGAAREGAGGRGGVDGTGARFKPCGTKTLKSEIRWLHACYVLGR